MSSRTVRLRQVSPDWDLWKKLYYQHQQAYLRQRLLAIKYLWEGIYEILDLLNLSHQKAPE
jgi:hypothetical protein